MMFILGVLSYLSGLVPILVHIGVGDLRCCYVLEMYGMYICVGFKG